MSLLLFLNDDIWLQSVTELPGIGPARAARLANLGVRSWADLTMHLPRSYSRFTKVGALGNLSDEADGTGVIILGRVGKADVQRSRRRKHLAVETATLHDATGAITLRWFVPFRGPLPPPRLQRGTVVSVYGALATYGRQRIVVDARPLAPGNSKEDDFIEAIYPLTAGISQRLMQQIVQAMWDRALPAEEYYPPVPVVSDKVPSQTALLTALRSLHLPRTWADVEAGRRLLAWAEIINWRTLQMQASAVPMLRSPWPATDGTLVRTFLANVPYALTEAQKRAIGEIRQGMARQTGMRRFLSGDVGTGKSVVIAYTLLKAAERGGQGVLIVPTRILANQHYETLKRYYSGLGVELCLLTAAVTGRGRERALAAVASGRTQIIVGTVAALQNDVSYHRLLTGVIDEQHRFGVEQRLALERRQPIHALWVSATPIPKSMAAVIFGATPISYLDERPPGRLPIDTRWINTGKRKAAYNFLHKEIVGGGRGFVVCPVIEEDPEAGIPGAMQTWRRLQTMRPGGLDVALVHGRLSAEEQEDALQRFVNGDAGTLVATSMVEVGVDVPAATVMIIEGAERFGLAQLHQLRGRVGRGVRPSYFIAISDSTTGMAAQRLQAIKSTDDGFALAEADLSLRGPGEFLGVQQSGVSDMRFADFALDLDLFRRAVETETRN